MLPAAAALGLLLLVQASAEEVAEAWKQCGGKDMNGNPYPHKTCPAGYTCHEMSPEYWQCWHPQPCDPLHVKNGKCDDALHSVGATRLFDVGSVEVENLRIHFRRIAPASAAVLGIFAAAGVLAGITAMAVRLRSARRAAGIYSDDEPMISEDNEAQRLSVGYKDVPLARPLSKVPGQARELIPWQASCC